MAKDVFRELQEQLDTYSLGFPATDSGTEITILKKLFKQEEAEMFLRLTPKLEIPAEIADRTGMPVEEVTDRLKDMAGQGLLFSLTKDGAVKYGAIPFVHGLFEFQVKRIDRDLASLFYKYMKEEFRDAMVESVSGFLRTIPVQRSVDVKHNVAAYEDAAEILKKAKQIVVTECICRKTANLIDKGCSNPSEVCFMFGSMGQYYLDHDMGRRIEVVEALKILTEAQEAGLVTQPATSQNPQGMCNCCGDCCGPLISLNSHPKPSEMVFSNYFAEVEKDSCSGCLTCQDRCQMEAVKTDDDDLADIELDRCIGCGLCVTTCPTESMKLTLKPEEKLLTPPANTFEQMLTMAQKRGVI
ncbi:MAG: 4Fe-4S ferredoxin [Proteobacteria bacterium]|nr:4Fe-4S ferredoxin [Pseudomonadota bacterium]